MLELSFGTRAPAAESGAGKESLGLVLCHNDGNNQVMLDEESILGWLLAPLLCGAVENRTVCNPPGWGVPGLLRQGLGRCECRWRSLSRDTGCSRVTPELQQHITGGTFPRVPARLPGPGYEAEQRGPRSPRPARRHFEALGPHGAPPHGGEWFVLPPPTPQPRCAVPAALAPPRGGTGAFSPPRRAGAVVQLAPPPSPLPNGTLRPLHTTMGHSHLLPPISERWAEPPRTYGAQRDGAVHPRPGAGGPAVPGVDLRLPHGFPIITPSSSASLPQKQPHGCPVVNPIVHHQCPIAAPRVAAPAPPHHPANHPTGHHRPHRPPHNCPQPGDPLPPGPIIVSPTRVGLARLRPALSQWLLIHRSALLVQLPRYFPQ